MTANSSDYGRLFFQAEVFRAGRLNERRVRPAGAITEPARRVPLFRDCDVLVAGGGPAGTAAAIAAVRAGADVVLIERHNHLGGLSTGGLVIWIDRPNGPSEDIKSNQYVKSHIFRVHVAISRILSQEKSTTSN